MSTGPQTLRGVSKTRLRSCLAEGQAESSWNATFGKAGDTRTLSGILPTRLRCGRAARIGVVLLICEAARRTVYGTRLQRQGVGGLHLMRKLVVYLKAVCPRAGKRDDASLGEYRSLDF